MIDAVGVVHRNTEFSQRSQVAETGQGQPRRRACHAQRGERATRQGGGCSFGNGDDVHTVSGQFAGKLKIQRAVAGNQDTLSWRHAVGPEEGLRRTRCHDAGQGPARKRWHRFIGTGGDDQFLRQDSKAFLSGRCGNLELAVVAAERTPDGGAEKSRGRGRHELLNQFTTLAVLRVIFAAVSYGGDFLLEVLSAGSMALIDHHNVLARLGETDRGSCASGSRANNQNIAGCGQSFLVGRFRYIVRRLAAAQCGYRHVRLDRCQAGARCRFAVNRYPAFKTTSHAAQQSARFTGLVSSQAQLTGSGHCRGDTLTFHGGDAYSVHP